MKFGDLFRKEWVCVATNFTLPCWYSPEGFRMPGHERCGYRYLANLNEYDFNAIKDRIIK